MIGHFADLLVCSLPYFGADLDHISFVQALLTVLLPTSFFFVFLYYTDIGALTFFLAAYWVSPILTLLAISTEHQFLPVKNPSQYDTHIPFIARHSSLCLSFEQSPLHW